VAASAIAKRMLSDVYVFVVAYLKAIDSIQIHLTLSDVIGKGRDLQNEVRANPLFCPDAHAVETMQGILTQALEEKNSLGGIVEATAFNVPVGWGDPIYEKLKANLAKAMLSLPASKGFEIGEGFAAAQMLGSQLRSLPLIQMI
jgi:chorismate synthase